MADEPALLLEGQGLHIFSSHGLLQHLGTQFRSGKGGKSPVHREGTTGSDGEAHPAPRHGVGWQVTLPEV